MEISGRKIKKGNAFIIAEISANHCKDFNIVMNTIEAAVNAGADAIKLQTVDPEKITLNCDNKFFQVPSDTAWAGKTLYELEVETFLPKEWHKPIFDKAKELGIICFSSPFDLDAIDFLEGLNCPAYKIASFEITDVALIRKAASTKKPIILSTGIATKDDIDLAVETCLKEGNNQIVILKCTSSYPTSLSDVNLLSMNYLGERYNCAYGLSDHTIGDLVAIGSIPLGASVIEKHFILNSNIKSADAFFSMNPKDFKIMVEKIRKLELALGDYNWNVNKAMISGRRLSRSLFVTEDIGKGMTFSENNVRSIRPGYGIHPKYINDFIGKKAFKNIKRGEPLNWDMLDNSQ